MQRAQKRKRVAPKESSDSSSDLAAEQSDDSSSGSEGEEEEAAKGDDAPVLSHAELRRQKKKQQKATTQPTEDGPAKKTQKAVKNTAELAPSKVPRRQNSVWVGNMAFKTTPDALRRFFDGVGEITRVHMPMKMASGGPGARGAVKENRGFVCLLYISHGVRIIYFPLSFLPVDLRTWTLQRPRPRRSQLHSPRTHSTVGSSS